MPALLHGPNLVGHERHERAHDKGHAFHDDGGHLVAHRLAGAGGHDRQHVATGQQCRDHRLLPRSERVVAETARQHSPRLLHLLLHERSPAFSRSRLSESQYSGYRRLPWSRQSRPQTVIKFPARSPRQPLRRRHCVASADSRRHAALHPGRARATSAAASTSATWSGSMAESGMRGSGAAEKSPMAMRSHATSCQAPSL